MKGEKNMGNMGKGMDQEMKAMKHMMDMNKHIPMKNMSSEMDKKHKKGM